jgi:UDP-N-acetylglucosamine 4,6-dehydratase
MTRFWITLGQGVDFVLKCLEMMRGGEIFVPKVPSMTIVDLARAIAPNAKHRFTGIRPGEKLHEILVTEDESRNTIENANMFITLTPFDGQDSKDRYKGFKSVEDGFRYSSDKNERWLTKKELAEMIKDI